MGRTLLDMTKIVNSKQIEVKKEEHDKVLKAYNKRSTGNLLKYFQDNHIADGAVMYVITADLGTARGNEKVIVLLRCTAGGVEELEIPQEQWQIFKQIFDDIYGKEILAKI